MMAQVTALTFPRSFLHTSRRSTTAVTENSGTVNLPFCLLTGVCKVEETVFFS